MPRFRVVAETEPEIDLRGAVDGVGDRFPEVDVESDADDLARQTLVCRAPSEAHVQRCMDAAGIEVRTINRV